MNLTYKIQKITIILLLNMLEIKGRQTWIQDMHDLRGDVNSHSHFLYAFAIMAQGQLTK
jgi:hypothetical protein